MDEWLKGPRWTCDRLHQRAVPVALRVCVTVKGPGRVVVESESHCGDEWLQMGCGQVWQGVVARACVKAGEWKDRRLAARRD